jgi:low temperature requirement protein LtrA
MTTLSRRPSRVTETPQGATYVELFFDLVFVYAVTQVTSLLVHDLTWGGAGRAAVMAWLVWWAWQQFTWTLSPADTTNPVVELTVLAASAVAFFMARAVAETFVGNAWQFLVPYLLVRLIGMWLYGWVGGDDRQMGRSMAVFGAASLPAVAALVLGAAVGPDARVWLWSLALLLDLGAGFFARRVEWNIHVSHFAERHALFVIIALGESLIAIGVASADIESTLAAFLAKGAGVSLVCVMWWGYFGWFGRWLEERVEESPSVDRIRNCYSFLHFPVVAGVIAVAAALEEVVAHPGMPLERPAAAALALGLALYFGVVAVLALAAGRLVLQARVAIIALMAVASLGGTALDVDGATVVGVVAVLGAVLALFERPRLA